MLLGELFGAFRCFSVLFGAFLVFLDKLFGELFGAYSVSFSVPFRCSWVSYSVFFGVFG